jgi:hypothetical protein
LSGHLNFKNLLNFENMSNTRSKANLFHYLEILEEDNPIGKFSRKNPTSHRRTGLYKYKMKSSADGKQLPYLTYFEKSILWVYMNLLSVLFFFLALNFPISLLAQEAVTGSLRFDMLSYDFGDVYRGQMVTHRFTFTNAGEGPLVIQGVHAACGCTAVEIEKGKKYQPGEAGHIEVKLDTTHFIGPMVKTITVLSNEKVLPDRILTVKAQVKTDIMAEPPMIDFGDIVSRVGAEKSIKITPIPPFVLKVARMDYNQDILTAQLTNQQSHFLLTVSVKKDLAPRFLRETLVIKTNSKHLEEMPIPIRGTIKGPIEFAPHYLEFGAIEPTGTVRRSLSLKGLNEFSVTGTKIEMIVNGQKIEGSDRFLTISTLNHEKERKLISVTLKNSLGIAGSVHGKLFILTSDKDQKEVAVDFYAFFR